jgi:Flp pilus assembly protein TadG
MKHKFSWLEDERGSSAVEFAIVGPVFLMLMVGTIYAGLLFFQVGSLQYAVEEGARCASVKTTVCTGSPATINYTNAAYHGAVITPVFVYSTPACGHAVTGSANFQLDFVLTTVTVPLSATACFP